MWGGVLTAHLRSQALPAPLPRRTWGCCGALVGLRGPSGTSIDLKFGQPRLAFSPCLRGLRCIRPLAAPGRVHADGPNPAHKLLRPQWGSPARPVATAAPKWPGNPRDPLGGPTRCEVSCSSAVMGQCTRRRTLRCGHKAGNELGSGCRTERASPFCPFGCPPDVFSTAFPLLLSRVHP